MFFRNVKNSRVVLSPVWWNKRTQRAKKALRIVFLWWVYYYHNRYYHLW